ncbi:phospholipase D-like domain-containing protein [Flavobacterium capsici]|uniref:phospholipase D n=1 Tax=Flavobacterium capsici TaxID=3075618 RepID=A0AA96J4C7_9FLAO|nr:MULTISPECIES: phospholipase D-like domain-containing protein [unclassified Flavobacterium]WNM20353.1 phospholipase D-like domain-containing protein [Flavobacterium sp. PMR2A8]WNM21743.1 phospholipase D-like domain-containing protein [Flavobacterium sp. PMTSA4]
MKILTTPWKDQFLELVANAKTSIKITSPFLKEPICSEMLEAKHPDTSLELITSFKLSHTYSGSLDIDALMKISHADGVIKNYSKLHSKIYLFDDKEVIISSGNLTDSGLSKNFEYGIYSKDEAIVSKVVEDFNSLSNHENTNIVSIGNLVTAKEILSKIPIKKNKFPLIEFETVYGASDLLEVPTKSIRTTLTDWRKEVFLCIDIIPRINFTLEEINAFEPHLKRIYPDSYYITDKIMEQLLYLRDIGLVEFLGNDNFRKLWK